MFKIGLILLILCIIGFIICVIFVWAIGLLCIIGAGSGVMLMCFGKAEEAEPNNGIDRKEFVLDDVEDHTAPIKCAIEIGHEIWFTADGYGDHCSQDGQGSILMIENKNGALMLYVWDDINEEEPRLISLANAKESNRK